MSQFEDSEALILRNRLQQKFNNYNLNKEYSYDEVLFIFDEQSQSGRCDRDVAGELFQQSVDTGKKATLNQIIFQYVQNLQTSRLCLKREQKVEQSLTEKINNLKGSRKTYVYLKIIQATIYARHSSTPSFSYKIWPSDVPPVTIVNSLNPILNHQYTLQLQTDTFSIIFYESGVKIGEWTWPDSPESVNEGEYHRTVTDQNISFQLKINYKPINSHPDRRLLQNQLISIQNKKQIQVIAFQKLSNFQPFLQNYQSSAIPVAKSNKSGRMWYFTQKIFSCMPFLRNHVLSLYYLLIALIFFQCLSSLAWPMQFLDITAAFGIIGILYDRNKNDIGMQMLLSTVGFSILIVKSILGIFAGQIQGFYWRIFLIITIVIEILCIFVSWIVMIRKQEVPQQRANVFYNGNNHLNDSKKIQFQI